MLCEAFQEGAKKSGHHVDWIRIQDKTIGFCMACDGCMRNRRTCVLKDDMNMTDVLKLYQNANILVLATPIYFYGISAQMKTFIDRTYPIWQTLEEKEVYYIILFRQV